MDLQNQTQQKGDIQKHKARLVARGFTQKQGIDFYETFSPVARLETTRTVIVVAAQRNGRYFNLMLNQLLNEKLDEEIYVEQPQGFFVQGGEEKLYKLKNLFTG